MCKNSTFHCLKVIDYHLWLLPLNMIIEWSSQMSHPHHDRRHVHHLDHLAKDHLFLILLSSNSAWALLMALLSSAISFPSSDSSSLQKMKKVITYSFLLSSISSSLQQKAEYSYTGHKLHNMTMDLGIGCSALFSVCSSGFSIIIFTTITTIAINTINAQLPNHVDNSSPNYLYQSSTNITINTPIILIPHLIELRELPWSFSFASLRLLFLSICWYLLLRTIILSSTFIFMSDIIVMLRSIQIPSLPLSSTV